MQIQNGLAESDLSSENFSSDSAYDFVPYEVVKARLLESVELHV